MRIIKISGLFLVCACVVLTNGCVSQQQYKDLKIQNDTQRQRIEQLESRLQTAKLERERLQRQLDAAKNIGGVETDALRKQIAALEEDITRKKALIDSMQRQLLGGVPLPVELATMLEDFAKSSEMVTYDASRGIVKFKSDLLFKRGSDEVAPDATEAVKSLCAILNSEVGKKFDVIVAGHTDDMRIAKPETRAKHPTNWYLSAHRAISAMNVMAESNIDSKRMSIRGFGEFRPVVDNKPNKAGNPQNRRVEIYIVTRGM